MIKNIESIMNPRSIAVVGATNRTGSVGLAVFRNILRAGFQGVLYPVNPKARSVQSVRAYPTISDIPDIAAAACRGSWDSTDPWLSRW